MQQDVYLRAARKYGRRCVMPKRMPACLSGGEIAHCRALVPGEGVIDDLDELKAYETDALTPTGEPPMIVVLRRRPRKFPQC